MWVENSTENQKSSIDVYKCKKFDRDSKKAFLGF